jgi:hypothetical protein
MSKLPLFTVALSVALLAGCRSSSSGRHSYAMEMCVANIPVYAPGQVPPVPYRMISPVDSHWGVSSASRFEHMKVHACELGADAIIDSADRYPSTSTVTTTMQYDAAGRPIQVQEQAVGAAYRNQPVAIKFMGPMPAAQVAVMPQPGGNVTIVPPPSTVTIVAPPPTVSFVQQ